MSAFPTFQRVPLDVLREIALHTLPMYPYPSLKQAPLSLGRVSSASRAAVLSSPQIWKMLYLRVRDEDNFSRCATLMKEWFQRVGALPLSFFLDLKFDIAEEKKDLLKFVSEVSRIMPKLCHFGVKAQYTINILHFLPGLESELPQLARIDLLSRYVTDYPEDLDPEDDFMIPLVSGAESSSPDGPELQEVVIARRFVPITSAVEGDVPPWSQLTAILLDDGIPLEYWIELMDCCPKLRDCSMFVYFSGDDEDEEFDLDDLIEARSLEPEEFTLTVLENLNLGVAYNYPPFLNLLSLFKLPALRNLRIYHDDASTEFPDPAGNPTLRNLRSLTLNAHWINHPDMVGYALDILRETVNLEELRFEIVTYDFISVFAAMSYKQPIILPRLKT